MATGNKPTAAFVLVLLGGIFVLIGGIMEGVLGAALTGIFGLGALGAIGGVLGIVSGIIMILASVMLYNTNVSKVKTWSIIALVFSIISLGAFGGFVIGFILGLIGSILGLTYKG